MKEILIITKDRKLIKGKLCSFDVNENGIDFEMEVTGGKVYKEGTLDTVDILVEVDSVTRPNHLCQS